MESRFGRELNADEAYICTLKIENNQPGQKLYVLRSAAGLRALFQVLYITGDTSKAISSRRSRNEHKADTRFAPISWDPNNMPGGVFEI